MIEIKGQYGTAKVFTDTLEPSAEGLIRTFCDQPYSADSKIRIMPDVHAGKGCTIGTTMTVKDTASTTPEAIYSAERSKQEATEFIERELKCPQCGFLIAYAFSDAKGHLKIKCKKCKKESVLNLAYFCRRKIIHRLYRVSNSRSKY